MGPHATLTLPTMACGKVFEPWFEQHLRSTGVSSNVLDMGVYCIVQVYILTQLEHCHHHYAEHLHFHIIWQRYCKGLKWKSWLEHLYFWIV
jgi:hypothetical protein